jgi:hypothetical protein
VRCQCSTKSTRLPAVKLSVDTKPMSSNRKKPDYNSFKRRSHASPSSSMRKGYSSHKRGLLCICPILVSYVIRGCGHFYMNSVAKFKSKPKIPSENFPKKAFVGRCGQLILLVTPFLLVASLEGGCWPLFLTRQFLLRSRYVLGASQEHLPPSDKVIEDTSDDQPSKQAEICPTQETSRKRARP